MAVPPPIPDNDAQRLETLRALLVLDSEPEAIFDRLVRLASEMSGAPIALLTLVDAERQWFKASVGLPGLRQTPRDVSFCAHAIATDEVMEVRDAAEDPRFFDNPLVCGEPGIRFYAGAPLTLPGGMRIGALCIVDRQPRRLSATQLDMLKSLAGMAADALHMRRDMIEKSLSVRSSYERGLADSESRYRAIVEDQSEMVSLATFDGELAYVNPAYARLFGRTPAQMIGTNLFDYIEPSDRAMVRAHLDQVISAGHSRSDENRMVGPDGTMRWVDWTNAVQRQLGGEALLHSVGRDVTERRALKAQLASTAADYRDLYDNAPCGYHTLDAAGRYAEINQTELRWLGCSRAEVIGRLGPEDFLSDADKATFRRSHARVLAEGVAEDQQFELVGRGGTTRRVGVSATAQRDAEGRFIRVLSVMYDQTAQHEAGQLRLKAATIEAENRALMDFARAKGQFLSSMSHELRTPLNGVLGFAQLLQGSAIGPESPKYAQYLAQINASGRQLLALIEALLDASRLQAGTLNFSPQRVDLGPLVVDTVESYRPAAQARHMELGAAVDHAGPACLDPMRFRQVLGALLSNAIKFGPPKSATLVRVQHEGTDHIRVTVVDQGPGIAAADLARLFLPFSQLSVGTARSHDGVGLGLSLVKQLVESQGGRVGVHSTPGVGSSFHFVLPIRPAS